METGSIHFYYYDQSYEKWRYYHNYDPGRTIFKEAMFGFSLSSNRYCYFVGSPYFHWPLTSTLKRGILHIHPLEKGYSVGEVNSLLSDVDGDFNYGWSISASDEILVVGAPLANNQAGQIYIYGLKPENCNTTDIFNNLQAKVQLPAGKENDRFGESVNIIDIGKIIVGAPGYDDPVDQVQGQNKGAFFIIKKEGTLWNVKLDEKMEPHQLF